MNDSQRLKEMIGKLRARERAAGEVRHLSGKTADSRLLAILTEISETILPRRVSFVSESGGGIHLAVANRRLQGVLGPADNSLSGFVGKALSDPESSEVAELKPALIGALMGDDPFVIRSRHLGNEDLGSDAGLSSDALTRAWGLAADEVGNAAKGATLEDFLAGVGDDAKAWLKIDGEEIADQSGAAEDIELLSETAAYILDAYLNKKDALFPSSTDARGVAIGGASRGVFFADVTGQSAFVLTDPDKLGHVASAWHGSLG